MIKASSVITGIVYNLRDIPALVTLVGGSAARIFGYQDVYPLEVNVFQRISRLQPGSVMVFVQSRTPGGDGSGPWKHLVEFALMPDDGGKSEDMEDAIVNGIVTATGLRMEDTEPIPELEPMQVVSVDRAQVDFGDSTFEYPRIVVSYTQKWPTPSATLPVPPIPPPPPIFPEQA